jgi:hypothetical protein
MDTKVIGKARELPIKKQSSLEKMAGARPLTGVEALWDKIDGQAAGLILAGGMAAIVIIVGIVLNLLSR